MNSTHSAAHANHMASTTPSERSSDTKSPRHLYGFPGGIYPDEHKALSNATPIEVVPTAPLLILPLKQHAGPPAAVCVEPGQRVVRGQLLAQAASTGFSAAIHAPADGVISFIGPHPVTHDSGLPAECIALATDADDVEPLEDEFVDDSELDDDDMRARIAGAGIVGLGGAGFPAFYKLTPKVVKHLIINGAECEPYITCDEVLMRERALEIIRGIRILERLLKPESILFAIEDNKPEAIAAIAEATLESNIEYVVIPSKYPSGAQKQLVQNLLGIEIPQGHHSIDYGVVMYNVGTCYAITRALAHSEPLITRIVTVTGGAVNRPGNYEVAIGTPIEYLLECAGVNPNKVARVVMGGPLMGVTVNDVSAPITKISNCFIVAAHGELDEDLSARECIRCGDCVEVCPATLLPQQLYWFIKTGQPEKAQTLHLDACIECGACAYVCPSHIPLVQYYRHGKAQLEQAQAAKALADHTLKRFEYRQQRTQQEQLREQERRQLRAVRTPPEQNINAELASAAETDIKPVNDAEMANADAALVPMVVMPAPDRSKDVAAALARARAKKLSAQTFVARTGNESRDEKPDSDSTP